MLETANQAVNNIETVALRRLDNGMLLAAYENFVSPAVILRGVLEVGAMDEPATENGVASMAASLLTRGTQQLSYETINETIEGVGAGVSISGRTHTTAVSTKSLAEDFPMILDLTSQMLRAPTFPEEQVRRVREQRVTALRERLNNTRAVAELLFYETAYPPGHPYHRDPSGTPESVSTLTRDELVQFHDTAYGPVGAIFVVVGAIPAEEALDQLAAVLGDWRANGDRGSRIAPPVPPTHGPERRFQEMPGKTQSDIVYGLPTIARDHPDFLALRLANTVLGVFGMMGRIGKRVRDEQGLAYYARSSIDATLGPSAWNASAGVSPDKVEQAVESIQFEWERLAEELVPEEELSDSKALLTYSLPLRLETNEGIARTLLDILYYDLGLDYLRQYPERIASITPKEVRAVAQRHFDPTRATLAIAGPVP